jgi:hypothetical protein
MKEEGRRKKEEVYGGVRCRVWEGYSDMNQTVENPQPKPNQKRDATSIWRIPLLVPVYLASPGIHSSGHPQESELRRGRARTIGKIQLQAGDDDKKKNDDDLGKKIPLLVFLRPRVARVFPFLCRLFLYASLSVSSWRVIREMGRFLQERGEETPGKIVDKCIPQIVNARIRDLSSRCKGVVKASWREQSVRSHEGILYAKRRPPYDLSISDLRGVIVGMGWLGC